MSIDIYLKIDGIPGMSEVKGFEGQIPVSSFNWQMNQTTSFGKATGGGAGRAHVGDISFVHEIDKATPKLMLACCLGTHIKSAAFTFRNAGGESAVDFFKVTLTDVVISAVSPTGVSNGDSATESVSIAFAEYKVEYQEQDNAGKPKGGPVIAGYSVQKNAKTA